MPFFWEYGKVLQSSKWFHYIPTNPHSIGYFPNNHKIGKVQVYEWVGYTLS
jgi:hypothetical protein